MSVSLVLAADEISSVSVLDHFVWSGGWITKFVLVPLSFLAVALIVHYLFVVRRSALLPTNLARALVAAAHQGQTRALLDVTREDHTLLGQAAYAGLSRLNVTPDAARAAIDEVVEAHATRLFRKIEYLNIVGNVSPMIGLLGTVVGMINAFGKIFAAGGGMPDAGRLAGDISVALVTTFWGLLIAIPSLTAFAMFRNRIDAFAAECVKLCDTLVTLMHETPEAAAPRAAAAPAPRPSQATTTAVAVRTQATTVAKRAAG